MLLWRLHNFDRRVHIDYKTGNIEDFQFYSNFSRPTVGPLLHCNANTLNSGFPRRVQNGVSCAWKRRNYSKFVTLNYHILWTSTDRTEMYFNNRDADLTYVVEICPVFSNKVKYSFH